LHGINNIYVANGTGRDGMITRSVEYRVGKHTSPSMNVSSCKAGGVPVEFRPYRPGSGPRPPSPARIDTLWRGERQSAYKMKKTSSLPELTKGWSK
ncbi:unnamed protein product, partial [Polarella glacialis]